MPLNLSGVAALDESFMLDSCTIERDPNRTSDDAWNDNTGTYTPPVDDVETVYSGKCYFWQESGPSSQEEGGATSAVTKNMVAIPRSADEPIVGDKVTCTSSKEDPLLDGKVFRVDGVIYGSFETSRRIVLAHWAVDPRTVEPT